MQCHEEGLWKVNFRDKILLFFSTLQMIFSENTGLLSKVEENQNKWAGFRVLNLFSSQVEELEKKSEAQVISF